MTVPGVLFLQFSGRITKIIDLPSGKSFIRHCNVNITFLILFCNFSCCREQCLIFSWLLCVVLHNFCSRLFISVIGGGYQQLKDNISFGCFSTAFSLMYSILPTTWLSTTLLRELLVLFEGLWKFFFSVVTSCQQSCGKIMFSVVCVCLLKGGLIWPLRGPVQTCSLGDPLAQALLLILPDMFKLIHLDLIRQWPPSWNRLESRRLAFDWRVFLSFLFVYLI